MLTGMLLECDACINKDPEDLWLFQLIVRLILHKSFI